MSLNDPETNGKGSAVDRKQHQPLPTRRSIGGPPRPMSFPEGSFASDSASGPPPARTRRSGQYQAPGLGSPDDRSSLSPSTNVSKDCFVIPQENLERFLPDGITVIQMN